MTSEEDNEIQKKILKKQLNPLIMKILEMNNKMTDLINNKKKKKDSNRVVKLDRLIPDYNISNISPFISLSVEPSKTFIRCISSFRVCISFSSILISI